MKWWLSKGSDPEGPFPAEHVAEWLRSGQIAADTMACPVDGQEWRPLREIDEFAKAIPSVPSKPSTPSPPPPPQPVDSVPAAAAVAPQGAQRLKSGILTAAIVLSACAVLADLLAVGDPLGELLMLSLLAFCAHAAAIVTWAVFHYWLWALLPSDVAELTPGKAVGFLFIPFFNFYWVFRSYLGVNKGLNRLAAATDVAGPRANVGIATAAAVFFVVGGAFVLWGLMLPGSTAVDQAYPFGSPYAQAQAYEEAFEINRDFLVLSFICYSVPNFVLWLLMVLNQKRMVEYLLRSQAPLNTASGLIDR